MKRNDIKTKANVLPQQAYEMLIKMAFIKAMVTQESQFIEHRGKLKKQKALWAVCQKIMAFNNELISLDYSGIPVADSTMNQYNAICEKLSKCSGFDLDVLRQLHVSMLNVAVISAFRKIQKARPEDPDQVAIDFLNSREPSCGELIKLAVDRLSFALLCSTTKHIDQTLVLNKSVSTPLFEAVHSAILLPVDLLTKSGANPVFIPKGEVYSATQLAISYRNVPMVKLLLNLNGETRKNYFGCFILNLTHERMDLPYFEFLVGIGEKLSVKEALHFNAARTTIMNRNREINRKLLSLFNINELTNNQKVEWLCDAAANPDPQVLQVIIDFGIDVNAVNEDGYTALILTTLKDSEYPLINLVKKGADIDFLIAKTQSTAIIFAAQHQKARAIRTLVSLGADISHRNCIGSDVLLHVIERRLEDLAFELIKRRAPINRIYEQGATLLHIATQCGLIRLTNYLLDQDLDPYLIGPKGLTYLHAAVISGKLDLVNRYLALGVNINAIHDCGFSALGMAVEQHNNLIAARLIDAGAHAKVPTQPGPSLIQRMICHCDIALVKQIIKRDHLDINLPESCGMSIAVSAIILKDLAYLIELAQDYRIHYPEHTAYSPLVYSIIDGRDDIAKWLLDNATGDIDHLCRSGRTPLSAAIYKNNLELVQLIIEHGSTIQQVDQNGHTPLMQAAYEGFYEIVELLLTRGADPNLYSSGFHRLDDDKKIVHLSASTHSLFHQKMQFSVIDLAAERRHAEIVDLLLRSGAKSISQDLRIVAFIEARQARLNKLLLPETRSLQERIQDKIAEFLKDVPLQDRRELRDQLETDQDSVVKASCATYLSERTTALAEIEHLAAELDKMADEQNQIARNKPNFSKLHKASLVTLKNIIAKLNRLKQQEDDVSFVELPVITLSKVSTTQATLDEDISYCQHYKLKDFPNLMKIRRSANHFVMPFLHKLVDQDKMQYLEAFNNELIDPKIARKFGSGIKAISQHECQVIIKEKNCRLPLEFEIKIASSDARILCYTLKPDNAGPIILVPAIYLPHGLHTEKEKNSNNLTQVCALDDYLLAINNQADTPFQPNKGF